MTRLPAGTVTKALSALFRCSLLGLSIAAAACGASSEDDAGGAPAANEESFTTAPLVAGLLHSWPGQWREDMHTDVPSTVLHGTKLYAAVQRRYLGGNMPPADAWHLAVIDVANPKEPKQLPGAALFKDQTQPETTNVHLALSGSGDRLFVVDEHRVTTFDLSPASGPQRLGSWNLDAPIVRGVHGIVASGTHLYIAADTGLFVVDTTLPDGPDTIARLDHAGADILFPAGIAVSGKKLFVGDRKVGFRIFDISNPASPVAVGATSGFEGNLVHVQGSNVLVTGLEGRGGRQFAVVRKYDLADPASPALVSSFRTGRSPYAITASASCAVVGYGTPDQQTQVIDTSGTTMTAKGLLVGSVATVSLATAGSLVVASRDHYGLELHTVTCP